MVVIIKKIICTVLIIGSLYYIFLVLEQPNYKKCDEAILNYKPYLNKDIFITTSMERKCNEKFFLKMKIKSFLFNDSNASFYIYKMSTNINIDKFYWLYISAEQGNINAQNLIKKGNKIDWTSD